MTDRTEALKLAEELVDRQEKAMRNERGYQDREKPTIQVRVAAILQVADWLLQGRTTPGGFVYDTDPPTYSQDRPGRAQLIDGGH